MAASIQISLSFNDFIMDCASYLSQLEAAAYAGSVVVVSIIVIIVGDCWRADFPAIRDGDLRVWDMRVWL